jgi:hypothetical protein
MERQIRGNGGDDESVEAEARWMPRRRKTENGERARLIEKDGVIAEKRKFDSA